MNDIVVAQRKDGSYEVQEQYLVVCPRCGRLELIVIVDRKFVRRAYWLADSPVLHR